MTAAHAATAAFLFAVLAAACSTTPSEAPPASEAAPSTATVLPSVPSVPSTPSATPSATPEPTTPPSPTAVPTAAPASGPPEAAVARCVAEVPSIDIEATPPDATAVTAPIAIGDASAGAAILIAPLPEDATSVVLAICQWRPAVDTHPNLNGGTVPATGEAGAPVERALRTQASPVDNVLGGRAAADVAQVQVALTDGTTVDALVGGGFWLAWWSGDAGSTTVTAKDTAGATISSVPFDVAAP